ncbi:MAG: hypothetical protein ACRES3_11880 [Steroidobacteraceae bacterium]
MGGEFADVVISDVIGRGRRCVAFSARKGNRDLVVKLYHPRAIARHARQCGGSLAQFEFERNKVFHHVPEFTALSAAPIGFVSASRAELFLQERVFGEPLRSFLRTSSAACRDRLIAELRTVLEHANQAGLFDLDLHPSNIIVKRSRDGTARPMLFDFNKVPYHVRPPKGLSGWCVSLGLIGRRSQDHRHLKRFGRPTCESLWRAQRYVRSVLSSFHATTAASVSIRWSNEQPCREVRSPRVDAPPTGMPIADHR